MRKAPSEHQLKRLHLIGSLVTVVALTLLMGAFFVWRTDADQRISLERLARSVDAQRQSRLQAEMDYAVRQIDYARSTTEDVLRRSIRAQVDLALQIAEGIYQRESAIEPAAVVRRHIVEALRPARFFDGRGYYFIDDFSGRFVLLPIAPQLENRINLDNRDDTGKYIMRGLIDAARRPDGEGFFSYRWYAPGDSRVMADKLAYVRRFAPYDWLIGTGDYNFHWENSQKHEALERLRSHDFGRTGHILVVDDDGKILSAPLFPEFEGRSYVQASPAIRALVEQFAARARNGGGLVRYELPARQGSVPVLKTALARRVMPWGWLVVATMQDDEFAAALELETQQFDAQQSRRWIELALALSLALALGLGFSYAYGRWLARLFSEHNSSIAEKNLALQEREALLRAVFDNAAVGIAQVTQGGEVIQANQYFCDFLGCAPAPVQGAGFGLGALLAAGGIDLAALAQAGADRLQTELRLAHAGGESRWASLSLQTVRDGTAPYVVLALLDIEQRKRGEAKLRLAASVFTHAREGIMITDSGGTIIEVNETFSRITGYSAEEAIGNTPRLLKSGRHSAEHYAGMWQALLRDGHWSGEIWNRRRNGDLYAEMQTISVVPDAQGRPEYFVALFTDISPLKQYQTQLERMAHYDALTGLPNRALLADRLQQAMLQCQRRADSLAVVYLDLDEFKDVNDRYGHNIGDRLLCELALRLKACLRNGDTLARIGGDEFVAVLVGIAEAPECEPVLLRLLEAAGAPLLIDGHALQVSASIGATLYPQDGVDPDLLMRHADQAMYLAKQDGKNRFHWFDVAQDAQIAARHEGIEGIRAALRNHEFRLWYQPKIDLQTRQLVGLEALIRWQHPQRGLLAPADFLSLIDSHVLGRDVGEWVIASALEQMRQWRQDGLELPVSVNISAMQLQDKTFAQRLTTLFEAVPDLPTRLLQLEVLESEALGDLVEIGSVMQACTEIGVSFALDDFGTGYSSLAYLRHLPAAVLKIDKSFVRDMLCDSNDLAIVHGVIGLARAFRREVIAEGVESAEHEQRLLALGCRYGQGYGISRPLPAAEVQDWVRSWPAGVA